MLARYLDFQFNTKKRHRYAMASGDSVTNAANRILCPRPARLYLEARDFAKLDGGCRPQGPCSAELLHTLKEWSTRKTDNNIIPRFYQYCQLREKSVCAHEPPAMHRRRLRRLAARSFPSALWPRKTRLSPGLIISLQKAPRRLPRLLAQSYWHRFACLALGLLYKLHMFSGNSS